jgi:hypothetical protein
MRLLRRSLWHPVIDRDGRADYEWSKQISGERAAAGTNRSVFKLRDGHLLQLNISYNTKCIFILLPVLMAWRFSNITRLRVKILFIYSHL